MVALVALAVARCTVTLRDRSAVKARAPSPAWPWLGFGIFLGVVATMVATILMFAVRSNDDPPASYQRIVVSSLLKLFPKIVVFETDDVVTMKTRRVPNECWHSWVSPSVM